METKKTATKSFYEQWLEQQTSFFQHWTNYGKDLQKNMGDTMPGAEVYRKWYEQQQEQFQKVAAQMTQFKPQFPTMPGFPSFPTFPGMQGQSFQMPTFPGMEQAQNYWKEAFENQQNFFSKNMGQGFNPFQNITGFKGDAATSLFGLYDNWLNLNRQISKMVSQGGDEMTKNLPNGVMTDTVKNMFSSTEAYVKLLEIWVPMAKKMQEETPTLESMKEMLSPEKYKEVLDKVFEFVSPEALRDFYTQATHILEKLGGNNKEALQRYQNMLEHNSKVLPELMAGDPAAAMKIYENMYEAYQKNLDPMLKGALNGRDAELMDSTKAVVGKVSDYVNRFTQFQYKLYVTGQKAMEKATEEQFEIFKKSGQTGNFNDFFKQWVETNESLFTDVFKSKEFNKLQNDLMEAGLEIKGEFQKVMEVYLSDYPVVPRSEMDALYKKVQDLQAKLRKMEGGAEVTTAEEKALAASVTNGKPKTPAAKKA